MALAPGVRLGPYEVLAPLGAGGMGEVYKARDTRLDRTVAIKVLPTELSADPERRARFEREARAVAALSHPNICALFDIGESPPSGREGLAPSVQPIAPVHYLVMEHLEGQTLADRLAKGPVPIEQALTVATEIADALSAAHRQGIIHRDLKPGNVMLTKAGAKLLDFGLAKLRQPEMPAPLDSSARTMTEPLTQAGEVLGTRPYMAPEQVEGMATDARTDLWALGCVLYEMVTGRPAFSGNSVASITAAILEREPEPLAMRQPLTPPALARVIQRCLAKDPDARWDSAHDVADELRWIAQQSGGRSPVRSDRAAPLVRPRWRLMAVVSFAVAVAALAFLWESAGWVGGWRDRVTRSSTPSAAPLVVAVLPFRNVAADARFAYLADGATEALTNGLARVPGLGGVVASASARQVAAVQGDARTAAERLGADRVVEGTSFGDGARVRFETRLSDRQGRVLWSDRADGAPSEILEVYENLLVKMTSALGRDLPLERRARTRPIDPEAHRLLVKALLSVESRLERDGIEMARQALALAPDYAEARRVLADLLSHAVYVGIVDGPPVTALRVAREHAERAIELDPGSGLAYKTRAVVRYVGGETAGAESDYRKALALAPGSAEIHKSWSWYLGDHLRPDECLTAAERGEALDPLTPSNASGWCLFLAGRYADAAARLERTEVERGIRGINPLRAAAYARAGQVEKARALRDELRRSQPPGQNPAADWWLIYVHLAEGDQRGARRLADSWWNKAGKSATTWAFVAQMYGALDDADRVVECFLRVSERCDNPDPCPGGWDSWMFDESIYSERVRRDPRLLDLAFKIRERRGGRN
jgi:TolB-like protein/Tfp pilus assembly protein PilF